jgi:hypothetical protein
VGGNSGKINMEDTGVKSESQVGLPIKNESSVRDRIVILGRRSAGKTVYLSLLYDLFWKSNGELTMKAVNGASHLEFTKAASELRNGIWPAATQNISQAFIEIEYRSRKKLAVMLDYPGELFTNAFVKDIESEETGILLDHIDHAEAIILLVDPSHVVSDDVGISVDNDFGLYQALNRVLNWADGCTVPVVLVLTKSDETQHIIKGNGGTAAFVKKYFPKMVQNVRTLRVCRVSAVQVEKKKDGGIVPKKGFKPMNLEMPIMYCFDVVTENDDLRLIAEKQEEYMRCLEALDKKEKNKLTIRYFIIFLIFLGLVLLMILILPGGVWRNVLEKIR